MRSILEEFWYGNVYPPDKNLNATDEAKELSGYIANHYESLHATLTENQKEIFEKFNDCYSELTGINEREIFIYAFRLGAKVAIEVMNFDIE